MFGPKVSQSLKMDYLCAETRLQPSAKQLTMLLLTLTSILQRVSSSATGKLGLSWFFPVWVEDPGNMHDLLNSQQ